jgi:hypothetical protein
VHGPLSLTLLLHAISGYVLEQTKEGFVIESIKYRNLAPLYCDEEMRLCGLQKDSDKDGATYDVWIEGPTGGVAVKGTVRTMRKPLVEPRLLGDLKDGEEFRRIPLRTESHEVEADQVRNSPSRGKRQVFIRRIATSRDDDVSRRPMPIKAPNETASVTQTPTGIVSERAEPTQKDITTSGRSGDEGTSVRHHIRRIRVAASDRRRRNRARSAQRELPRTVRPRFATDPETSRVTLSKFTIPPSVESVSGGRWLTTDLESKATSKATNDQITAASNEEAHRAHRRNRPARTSPPAKTALRIRQIKTTSTSLVRAVQSKTRQHGGRKARVAKGAFPVRRYASSPYATVLARHSTFEKHGPRKIERVRVRISERTVDRRHE